MKKALVFSTTSSGHDQYASHREKIIAALKTIYDVVDEFVSRTFEDGQEELAKHAEEYDYLILVGGDGTVHSAINVLMKLKKRPILGYINNGTLGDVGRSIGIPNSYKKALQALKDDRYVALDLVEANGRYFTYMAAIGAYSDVSYTAKRKGKRLFHRFAYYFASFKEAFRHYEVAYRIEADGREYEGTSPFFMLLNGTHVGGFAVNKGASNRDGKMEIYLTPKGPFNGLLHYFFAKKKVRKIVCARAKIHIANPSPWCFDGEKGEAGDLEARVLPQAIRVITHEKRKRK